MDKKLNELMEDLDKVLGLIKKIGESTPEDIDSVKEEIKLTRNELKGKYGEEDTPKPTHRKRSPFYWWRRFPTHKALPLINY